MMKAAVCYGQGDIRIEDVKLKELEETYWEDRILLGYVRLMSECNGLSSRAACHFHEYTGWIEKVGKNVDDIEVGTKVG